MIAPQPGTPLPWEVDTFQSEGEYWIGPDTTSGFAVSAIYDAKGRVLFDALNSDAIEVEEDGPDEDGFASAWDAVSAANAAYIVHACNNYPKAQAMADALRALRNEAWVNLTGGRGDLIDDASAALAAWDAKP